jgi:Domain of unknown function (DUF5655)
MAQTRAWQQMRSMSVRLLEERTGKRLDEWNQRIQAQGFEDEKSLRDWLAGQGVSGYAQMLLVMERFGYPDFLTASAEELIDAQYADRPQLRPILDAILEAAAGLGEVVIQARKGYVSLVTPRRTFARVVPTTKKRVDLALRLDGQSRGELALQEQSRDRRLQPSKVHETTKLQIGFTSRDEVDAEALDWLLKAYEQNR